MTAQLEPHTIDLFDTIPIQGSFKNFKLAGDTNGIPKDADMRLFHIFIDKSASVVLNAKLNADSSNEKSAQKTTVMSIYMKTYSQVVNFFLIESVTHAINA